MAEQRQVADDYEKNAQLTAALNQIVTRKQGLTLAPVNFFANYRPKLSSGAPWRMGQGNFLVITRTTSSRKANGTVFETEDL